MSATQPDGVEGARMTLGEHLDELRKHLLRSALALLVTFSVGFAFYGEISRLITWPFHEAVREINEATTERLSGLVDARLAAEPEAWKPYFESGYPDSIELLPEHRVEDRLAAIGPLEGFQFTMDIALYFALFTGAPYCLWELWRFVAAGLYANERRAVTRYVPWSVGLFVAGMVFSFRWCVPWVLYYLATAFPTEEIKPQWRVSEYFSVLSTMCLGMGILFQLPVAMAFVMRIGLVQPATFSKYRKYFYFASFVIAAILSPPDWFSTLAMCVPMMVLYELGILVGRFVARPRATALGPRGSA
jgi:sec-independent protein translocase protein TatC